MKTLPWFRLYNDIPQDLKIKKVGKLTRRPMWEVIGFWTCVLITASLCPERGVLADSDGDPLSDEELIDDMGIDVNTYHLLMDAFKKKNLIKQQTDGTYYIPKWDERQPASDSAAERMRRYRAKQKEKEAVTPHNEEVTETVTSPLRNALRDSYALDTDTDTELKESPPKKPAARPKSPKPSAYNQKRGELEKHFCTITGIPVPKTNTEKQRRAAGTLWWAPLREILELAEGDVSRGKVIIEKALTKLSEVTVTDPNSIIKTARAVSGEGKGTGVVSADLADAQRSIYGD